MYVNPGVSDGPASIVWLSADGVHQAVLELVADTAPTSSPSPVAPTSSAAPSASPKPTKKP
jgi:hypothetical protein